MSRIASATWSSWAVSRSTARLEAATSGVYLSFARPMDRHPWHDYRAIFREIHRSRYEAGHGVCNAPELVKRSGQKPCRAAQASDGRLAKSRGAARPPRLPRPSVRHCVDDVVDRE